MNPTCSHDKRWDEPCEECSKVSMNETLRMLMKDCYRVARELEQKPGLASDPRVVIDLFDTIARLSGILRRALPQPAGHTDG